jgi:hypothetical protein
MCHAFLRSIKGFFLMIWTLGTKVFSASTCHMVAASVFRDFYFAVGALLNIEIIQK